MKTNELYGFNHSDLDAARNTIETTLGIKMILHDSSFRCGDYYRFESADFGTLIIQKNYDQVHSEWTEENFKEKGILMFFEGTTRGNELESILSAKGIQLLKRK